MNPGLKALVLLRKEGFHWMNIGGINILTVCQFESYRYIHVGHISDNPTGLANLINMMGWSTYPT